MKKEDKKDLLLTCVLVLSIILGGAYSIAFEDTYKANKVVALSDVAAIIDNSEATSSAAVQNLAAVPETSADIMLFKGSPATDFYVTTDTTVLRKYPSASSEAVKEIPASTTVKVNGLNEENQWAEIIYENEIYYAKTYFLNPVIEISDDRDEDPVDDINVNDPTETKNDVTTATEESSVTTETTEVSETSESSEASESADVSETSAKKEDKKTEETKETKESRKEEETSKTVKESKETKESKESKESKETKETKESKETKKTEESKETAKETTKETTKETAEETAKKASEKPADKKSGYYDESEAKKVLNLVNKIRKQHGLDPVTWSGQLAKAARTRSGEIKKKFSHKRPNGKEWYTVSDLAYGENIAAGQANARKVVDAWMNSPGHKANILKPEYKTMGVGLFISEGSDYTYYWVQEFGY